MIQQILVAVDLNDDSAILVEKAAELAEKFGASTWILHVTEPEPDFVGNRVGPQYIRDLRADELRGEHYQVRAYADYLKARGLPAEGLLIQGATVDMILHEIHALRIDLVIIGHRRHSLLYRLYTGAVDSAVVQKARVPVMIVPLP